MSRTIHRLVEVNRNSPEPPCLLKSTPHQFSAAYTADSVFRPDDTPQHRWVAQPWMYLFWPITFLLSLWELFVSPVLFGPRRRYGRYRYKGATTEVRNYLHKPTRYFRSTRCLRRKKKNFVCSPQQNDSPNTLSKAGLLYNLTARCRACVWSIRGTR